jgi:phosphinothricin acetyltransferase
MTPQIRLATTADLPAINAIYNHYVLQSTCTYQVEPSTPEERQQWFDAHGPRLPVTVAVESGGEGRIVGWASLSPFHPRSAYRFTVEDSVYVHADCQRQGIGRVLLSDLLQRSDALGYRSVIALISADQAGSVALHRMMGFIDAGLLKRVGFKFDRWLDVLYMQREKSG